MQTQRLDRSARNTFQTFSFVDILDKDRSFFRIRLGSIGNDRRDRSFLYRYRMDRENLAKKLTDSLNPEGGAGKRDMLIGRLTGAPTVTTNTYTSSDVLSVRTTFQGMGVELILVDRI